MKQKDYMDAISDFGYALSINGTIKEAYKFRAECYNSLAETIQDVSRKSSYISLAEADQEKYQLLNTQDKK